MATGLLALLDDVATIAKVAAASLDDTAAAAAKAGAKAAAVVVDDAAVTPRYAAGFAAERELPIVMKIAMGSLRNKLLYLLPAALALSAVAPWAITPLLMAGAAYLCFEGAEKVHDWLAPHDDHAIEEDTSIDAAELERTMVAGAIRTDLILSSEIMAITLAAVSEEPFIERAIVLAVVGVGITFVVYGGVGLIVKTDDFGAFLARSRVAPLRMIGRGLVIGMPPFLHVLGIVGTLAMLWVGGGILLHGADKYGLGGPSAFLHGWAVAAAGLAGPVAEWVVTTTGSAIVGLSLGGLILAVISLARRRFFPRKSIPPLADRPPID